MFSNSVLKGLELYIFGFPLVNLVDKNIDDLCIFRLVLFSGFILSLIHIKLVKYVYELTIFEERSYENTVRFFCMSSIIFWGGSLLIKPYQIEDMTEFLTGLLLPISILFQFYVFLIISAYLLDIILLIFSICKKKLNPENPENPENNLTQTLV